MKNASSGARSVKAGNSGMTAAEACRSCCIGEVALSLHAAKNTPAPTHATASAFRIVLPCMIHLDLSDGRAEADGGPSLCGQVVASSVLSLSAIVLAWYGKPAASPTRCLIGFADTLRV